MRQSESADCSEEESEKRRLKVSLNSTVENLVSTVGEEEEKGTTFNAFGRETSASTNVTKKKCQRKSERAKYECSICQVYFIRQGEFKRHMVKHSDSRPYKCPVCDKAFKRLSELNSHMQIHNSVTYTCEACSFTTTNKVSLRTHNRRVHQRDLRYRCEQCNKSFMSNYDLEDHKASHLGTKFICEHCGNTYSQKSYLIAHKRAIHGIQKTARKQHQCDLCNKSFASEHNLRNHASLHSQSFLCAKCGKEFATNHALNLHSRIHTGERPYPCKRCMKAFARSAALRVHELTHTGERPYVCDLCGQSFTQRSSMMVHRRKHPGNHPPPPPLLLSRLEFCAQNSTS